MVRFRLPSKQWAKDHCRYFKALTYFPISPENHWMLKACLKFNLWISILLPGNHCIMLSIRNPKLSKRINHFYLSILMDISLLRNQRAQISWIHDHRRRIQSISSGAIWAWVIRMHPSHMETSHYPKHLNAVWMYMLTLTVKFISKS